MNTSSKKASAKLIVKKSQFHGYVFPINKENEVKEIIESIRKKHKSANHVCYAYKVSEIKGDNVEYIFRFDDDGEPSKTAGFPLQQIIEQKNFCDILLVVARVFGGIKLGTSGLIKAYGDAGLKALEETTVIEKVFTKLIEIDVAIKEYSRVEQFLKQNKLEFNSYFSENVRVNVFIPIKNKIMEKEFNLLLDSIL